MQLLVFGATGGTGQRLVEFALAQGHDEYRHGFTAADKPTRLKISGADVADFMLEQLTNDAYLCSMPGVSYRTGVVVRNRRLRTTYSRDDRPQ